MHPVVTLIILVLAFSEFQTINSQEVRTRRGGGNKARLRFPAGSLTIAESIANSSSHYPPSSANPANATGPRILTYTIDQFTLKIDTNYSQSKIEIYHSERLSTYFKTIPGQSFILAAAGQDRFNGENGVFYINDIDRGFCADQSIDEIKFVESNSPANGSANGTTSTELRISGSLKNSNGCNLQYSFILKALSRNQLSFSIEHKAANPHQPIKINDTAEGVAEVKNSTENSEGSTVLGKDYTKTFLRYHGSSDDRIYGFGMQYSHMNIQKQSVRVYTRENGLARAILQNKLLSSLSAIFRKSNPDLTTSIALTPYYFTSSLFSMFIQNTEYSVFDFHSKDVVKIKVTSNKVEGRFIYAKSYLDMIEEFTTYAGRMKPLPSWTQQGAIAGIQGGSERVRSLVKTCKDNDVALAGVWLQDWVGNRPQKIGSITYERLWWNWESDQKLYPDWTNLIKELKDTGIRTMAYVNSFLADPATKPSGFKRNLFKEALEKDYLVKVSVKGQNKTYFSSSGPGIQAGLVDLFKPEAYNWLKNVIVEQMVKTGVDGGMFDFGEYFPADSKLPADQRGRHNKYVELWAKLSSEIAAEYPDFVPFHRSGFTQSPSYARLFWSGDHFPNWHDLNGIKSAVITHLTSGFSGYSLIHGDVGGYFNVQFSSYSLGTRRTVDLLLRWMELGVFSPLYRTHEGSVPKSNAQFYTNNKTLAQFKRMSHLFKAMAPYRLELMEEAHRKGYPLIRAMFLQYPSDYQAPLLDEQFMFGSDMLVAPILHPNMKKVQVYLPKGEWQHLWTEKVYSLRSGEKVEIEAPIGKPVVMLSYPVKRESLKGLIEYARKM
ncbi:glycosyl hydrolases family 31-domain-containing protein [Paraphysoderma sedebokerense]|nr:glycosyl hydrolases family 31-domain-containing protein [Paraphysoderma sedebokerense]